MPGRHGQRKKKKKVDSECHAFKTQWSMDYFVIQLDDKALCFFNNNSIAVLKKNYNVHQHYQTKH